jgi:VCBS repeat-containing protein
LTDAAGAVTEDASATTLSDTGYVGCNDVDLTDVHTASVVKASGSLSGALTLGSVTGESATNETGSLGWTYAVANSATQYLAAGETASETFTVTVNDGQSGNVTQTVTATVTGTNDGPTIVAGSTDAAGAVTEDAATPTLSDTGYVGFSDIDLIDVHTASVVKATGTLGGTLTLGAVTGETATNQTGSVGWTYSVANSAVQYLAFDQTANETFTVTVADGQGGTVAQTVTVKVTGTNDAPVLTLNTSNTAVTFESGIGATGSVASTILTTRTDVDTQDVQAGYPTFVSSLVSSAIGTDWVATGANLYSHAGNFGTATLNADTGTAEQPQPSPAMPLCGSNCVSISDVKRADEDIKL